jgi:glycosyltransferase involved in cell wall biosynthesis
VCVQPSHWEGIGLPLLESQASGMPLVTTDAAPMNEYQTLRRIPVVGWEPVFVGGHHPIAAPLMTTGALVDTLNSIYRTDISDASRAARQFIERKHSWSVARELLREKLPH